MKQQNKLLRLIAISTAALLLTTCIGGNGNGGSNIGSGNIKKLGNVKDNNILNFDGKTDGLLQDGALISIAETAILDHTMAINTIYPKSLDFILELSKNQLPNISNYSLGFEKLFVTDKIQPKIPDGTQANPILIPGAVESVNKLFTMELKYVNNGTANIRVKELHANYGAYKVINNTCSVGKVLKRKEWCNIGLRLDPLSFGQSLPHIGTYKFSLQLPRFVISILDEDDEEIENISVTPRRAKFRDRNDANYIWGQIEYLNIKFERYLYSYLNKQKVARMSIDYNGLSHVLYKDVTTKTIFKKLSNEFKVLEDGGNCTRTEDEENIYFTCPVYKIVDRNSYSIPKRNILVLFSNVPEASTNNLVSGVIKGNSQKSRDFDNIRDELREITVEHFNLRYEEIGPYKIVHFNRMNYVQLNSDYDFSYNLTSVNSYNPDEERCILNYLNRRETGCVYNNSCNVRIDEGCFNETTNVHSYLDIVRINSNQNDSGTDWGMVLVFSGLIQGTISYVCARSIYARYFNYTRTYFRTILKTQRVNFGCFIDNHK